MPHVSGRPLRRAEQKQKRNAAVIFGRRTQNRVVTTGRPRSGRAKGGEARREMRRDEVWGLSLARSPELLLLRELLLRLGVSTSQLP